MHYRLVGYTLLKTPGLQSSDPRQGGLPALEIDGFGAAAINLPESTIGPYNNFQPQNIANVEREYVGNLTWIRGSHNLRAGADFDQQLDNEMQMLATFCSYCAGSGGFQFSQGTSQLCTGRVLALVPF